MQYKIDFNYGLGVYPVSLFVDIEGLQMDIFKTWEEIIKYNMQDIIFRGNIVGNIEELNFINSRLIGSRNHVSCLIDTSLDLEHTFTNLMVSRLIIYFFIDVKNSTYFKRMINLLTNLSNNDIIIIHTNVLKELIFVRQYFIDNGIKAKIALSRQSTIPAQELINNNIYDIFLLV